MMVTFVSQCEKKALSRTRRVLDAFANRIGDNTWQTVITQEGLLAVKKLLRKTASKNTAVSCHWIRGRSRTDLVWVVGRKNEFNTKGNVPVNKTSKEVPMDLAVVKPIKGMSYANTALQRLDHHLFAVGFVAKKLYLNLYPTKKTQANAVFVAGCLHDIGKLDPHFQDWVVSDKSKNFEVEDGQHIETTKFSFEKHPRHNEISLLIYELLDDVKLKKISIENKRRIKHAIYWHHAKPYRPKGGFETCGYIYKKLNDNLKIDAWEVVEKSLLMIANVTSIHTEYEGVSESILSGCSLDTVDPDNLAYIESMLVPEYKEYGVLESLDGYMMQANKNSANNEFRACLITADRWVSSLSAKELSLAIKNQNLDGFISEKIDSEQLEKESNLVGYIDQCLSSFPHDKRSKDQAAIAKKLSENVDHVGVLAGAAGCGKTKISLEWAKLRNAQQILWICPRVQICQGLFTELRDSDKAYLPDADIELYTGEFKCTNSYQNITQESDYFSGDVVITTIDQILSCVISHTKADQLLHYLNAHVVFDEYHEYINMPAFNLLFAELVASRKELNRGCNALLVSATPHYAYLKSILNVDVKYDIQEMPSFNKASYKFDFVQYDESLLDKANPLYQEQLPSTFVISNTAITAQKSFIQNQHNENAILLHSKYKKTDKQSLFQQVFKSFSRDGNQQYDVLRSGPIVQASLNVSCENMVSEVTNPENCLQRLGRLDRFGKNLVSENTYKIAVPTTLYAGKGTGAVARFLSSTNSFSSTKAWLEFLIEATDNGESLLKLSDIYKIYRDFYDDKSTVRKHIESDLINAMKKSVGVIGSKILEPQVFVKKKKDKGLRAKISKNSLRGDSRFVQMATCNVDNINDPVFIESYAYDFPTSENIEIDNLTASCESIVGYGDSSNNLLIHMMKKHHNIMGGVKAFKDFILLNEAKDPEFPIYLSYSPNDLLAVGGESSRHSSAIYYAVCEKQPIGAISIKHLITQKD